MSLATPLATPFYLGAGSSALVPHPYPVAIAGHAYLVDYAHDISGFRGQFFHHRSIDPLRPSQDSALSFGESSINQEGLARASISSWHRGAGQVFLQHPDSDPFRFRTSKGVDPWTRGQLSLLPDTASKLASANTNLFMVTAGADLYVCDGTALRFTADVTPGSPTWTAVTGLPGAAATSIASDGNNVYTSHTASGVYKTTRGAASSASFATGNATLVRYVKGRLMVAYQNLLYNVTGAGALPAALFTHPNSDFAWVDLAEGSNQIYAAGYSGDKSLIYRTAVKADGTALDVPVVAGELPDGEIVRSLQGYLGFVLIGSDKGVRFAEPNTNGDLVIGALIPTGAAVACFEPQDRFVWYGQTNYDATSTGLGRLDLTQLIATLTPAYATDLMATAQGAVQSVVTFQTLRVFTVSGVGVFAETANRVASGTLDSGLITYGIVDTKVAVYLDVRHQALAGTVKGYLSADGGTFDLVGTGVMPGSVSESFNTSQARGVSFETRLELDRSSTATTTGPTVTQQTLRSNPVPSTGLEIVVPVVLSTVERIDGAERAADPAAELAYLEGLRSTGQIVVYQEYGNTYAVTISGLTYLPHHPAPASDGDQYEATLVVAMKTLT